MSDTPIARFQIDGKVYTTAMLDEITLKDLLLFEVQARDLGLDITWSELQEKVAGIDPEAEVGTLGRDGLLIMAATIWASRRMAGEDLTFGEAIDVPLSRIVFLPDPEDRKPAVPTKARKSTTTKGSARRVEVESPARAGSGTTSATSE